MEFEPSVAVWRSRGNGAVLDVSSVNGKDGSKLVLVTTREEVLEYCTQSRKCVNHWTFRAGSNLALRLGAVRNSQSQVLYGVRGAKKASQAETIVAWRNSDLEVAKWKTSSLSEKSAVAGLYVHPRLTEEVVVVYENGKFAVYDEDLVKLLDASDVQQANGLDDNAEGQVVWASLASDHRNPMKGSLFLSLLVKSKSAQYDLVIYQIFSKKDRKDARVAASLVARQSIELETSKNAEIASSAFHAETFSYSFVWSTGEWQMVSFQHDAVASTLEWTSSQRVAAFSAEYTTPASLTPVNKKRKLAQAAAAGNSAAGFATCNVGNFSYLVVSNASNPKALTGWDAKFGVQVASTEIDFSSPESETGEVKSVSSSPVGSMVKLLSSLNGEVVVAAYEHAVFVVNVKNRHSTLASVLGASVAPSASTTTAAPGLPNRSINWTNVAAKKTMDASGWKDELCSEGAVEQQYIADLSDPLVTSTAAQFTKKFDEAVKKLGNNGSRELSYRFLIAVTKRCVESDKLALWGPLKAMIASKRISTRAVPSLLPTLMKHAQYELLELAILHLTDIDERSVVRMLKFFIRKNQDKKLLEYVSASKIASGGKRKKSSAVAESTSEGVSASERFLVAVLGLPTNNVFLHHAIRELQLDDVLFLLAVCKKFFFALTIAFEANDSTAAEPKASTKKSKKANGVAASPAAASLASFHALVTASALETLYFTKLPSAFQFSAWICALIDGHFAQLVLAASKDAKVAAGLQNLDALVQKQLQSCAQFETVQSVLSNFLSGVKLPRAHGIPDYSIEELLI